MSFFANEQTISGLHDCVPVFSFPFPFFLYTGSVEEIFFSNLLGAHEDVLVL